MLRAVIFDFDGVIADSEPLHLRAFNKVLAQFGIEINSQDYYLNYLGFRDCDCFDALAKANKLSWSEADIEKLVEQKSEAFEELVRTDGGVIEGVPEFLEMLRKNHVRIAMCSGALRSDIETILGRTGLLDYFEVVVTAEDVSEGKPEPEGFILTLRKLNEGGKNRISPSECVVVEDSHWGIDAARRAKMRVLAVTNSYRADELKGAARIVGNLRQVTIKELRKLCG